MAKPIVLEDLDLEARYQIAGFRGIAWRLIGYAQEFHQFEPEHICEEDDSTCPGEDECKAWFYDEGEWIDDKSRVRACMVGDNKPFIFDVEDLQKLDDLDYCTSCGQIGCAHDGRMRA